jgi:hypothetical protein
LAFGVGSASLEAMRRLLILPLAALAFAPSASASTPSACVLTTTDDAAKVLGGKVAAGKAQTLGAWKYCTYKRGSKTLIVQARVITKAAFEKDAKKHPQPVFPIPGIGDEAFSVGAGSALLVWQKGIAIYFNFVGVNPVVQTQKDVAKAALKRL